MMHFGLKKYYIILLMIITIVSVSPKTAYATKIVAIVNDDVITDTDVDDFEKSVCKLDKRFKCGTQNSRQMALISLVESVLKKEHFKQIQILNDKQINSGYSAYKKDVLKNINIPITDLSQSFEDYLHVEYIWNVMIASKAQQQTITEKDIENFISQNKITNKNKEQVKQLILQEKANNISQTTMAELKKFYLIDIKGL